ncbi:MAG: Glutathionylspermidine synthase [Idiomarinaceae bacterium HL-53]|nr:MAG: Glutathionylspermidine synthase [Idiomarinaceae bacterium HL-53]CUS47850.1 hypothetical protein Ga0003345_0784 [Idiomarinaceae bacterium HL-53]
MNDMNQKQPRVNWKEAEVYFEHAGRQIRIWFSTYSGAEKVFIDEDLVSEARSWRFKNTHKITIGNDQYQIDVSVKGWKHLFLGIYSVDFFANGQLVDQDQLEMMKHIGQGKEGKPFTWRKFFFSLLPFLIAGYFFGYFVAKFMIEYFGG